MIIPETIKEHKFKNAYSKLSFILTISNNRLRDYLQNYLSQEDLTIQQYNLLRILRGNFPEALSTNQIQERMFDKKSDTSRLVDRLIDKKLVLKKKNRYDNRLVDVRISAKGLRILEKLDGLDESMARFWGHITKKEAETISRLLDKAYAE
ncbi:MarR family transcriptional regulator [Niabella terrae]